MADSVEESFKRLEARKRQAASRQKSAFLATMSHELRTPLNGILGFAELLRYELENPEHRSYIDIIEQSGSHLLNLVNEILDLAKIESGEMRFNQVATPLASLITDCAASHQVSAQAKGLTFELNLAPDLPLAVSTDPTRLCQILNHLLSNAVKFTATGQISLIVTQREHEITFAVRDTGPGIPPENHEIIFEKFHQLANFLTREQGGAGLGLALVKQLAEHMGDASRSILKSASARLSPYTSRSTSPYSLIAISLSVSKAHLLAQFLPDDFYAGNKHPAVAQQGGV
jgi:signal transduction histidine kinase